MKTAKKIESYFNQIMSINYGNEHGGTYAYLQFLAYSREMLHLLKSVKNAEPHVDAIEGINWLLNECLSAKFSPRHQSIFENKRSEFSAIFDRVRYSLRNSHIKNVVRENVSHAQAA